MCESNFLPNYLNGVFPNPKTRDMFVWWCDHNGYFIKLTYSKLNYCIIIDSLLDSSLKPTLACIWRANVPSNIEVFIWHLLLNRLQTRDEFTKWGFIVGVHSLACPLCFGPEESHRHLFINCLIALDEWLVIYIGLVYLVLTLLMILLIICWLSTLPRGEVRRKIIDFLFGYSCC